MKLKKDAVYNQGWRLTLTVRYSKFELLQPYASMHSAMTTQGDAVSRVMCRERKSIQVVLWIHVYIYSPNVAIFAEKDAKLHD